MKIGELAKQSGVGIDALRFYERRGLVTAERRPSGYRAFTASSVERVRFVRELQSLGLSLDEIGEVLADVDGGATSCNLAALDGAVARVDARLADSAR